MSARFLLLSLLTLLITLPAQAQSTEGKRAKILQLLELSRAGEAYDAGMKAGFMASMEANPQIQAMPADLKPKFKRGMDRVLKLMLDKMGWKVMRPKIVAVYDKHWTEEELDTVIALFKSNPKATQLMVTKQMAMAKPMTLMSQKESAKLQAQIQAIIQEEMSKPE